MRILLTILIIVLILSVLGLIPVMFVRGQEPMQHNPVTQQQSVEHQRPREGGTFGIILNDRVYSLHTQPQRVTPHYPQYAPWQQYDPYHYDQWRYEQWERSYRYNYRQPYYFRRPTYRWRSFGFNF